MKGVMRKKTIENGRQYFTRSKKLQDEVAANEKDLISSLPLDLKLQILVKLPTKCIAKFISVSKLWSSIVRGKDLTDLFLSRSSTRPSFLFTVVTPGIRKFHSRSQEDQSSDNLRTSSITEHLISYCSRPVRGLICGEEISIDVSKVICNPTTGKFVALPRVITWGRQCLITTFIGYDPVNDQYKVCIIQNFHQKQPSRVVSVKHQVFTLGTRQKAWRKIECNPHFPATKGLCRDGVVYYGAWYNIPYQESLIVSFEDFGVIKLHEGVKIISHGHTELVNYYGNIALVVDLPCNGSNVNLWVLQDVKKREWSKISVHLPDIVRTWSNVFYCRGTISTREIIFAPTSLSKDPLFLVYYDLKDNNAKRVGIEGVRDVGNFSHITVFLDHVENPMFLQKEVSCN